MTVKDSKGHLVSVVGVGVGKRYRSGVERKEQSWAAGPYAHSLITT